MAADTATATPPRIAESPAEQPAGAVAETPPPPRDEAGAASTGKAPAGRHKAAKAPKRAEDAQEGSPAEPDGDGPSVAAHPRAARAVARAKGWGGLLGFLVGGYLALPTSTLAAAGLRALVAGLVCYMAAWALAVSVWRRLVMLEIDRRQQQLLEAQGGRALPELPVVPGPRAGARHS